MSSNSSVPRSPRQTLSRAVQYLSNQYSHAVLHPQAVDDLFASRDAYARYTTEFDDGPYDLIHSTAADQFHSETDVDGLAEMHRDVVRDLFALIRERQPDVVVETGVANGFSTLAILMALRANEQGHCHSVDYPLHADEPLDEFRAETYDGAGRAAIPSDKDPGWIIPDQYRDRWTLHIGKSQTELPQLRAEIDAIDLFLHDSEHSRQCQTFEFELAWEWLRDGGLLVADDITWTDAFDAFADARDADSGRLKRSVGYLQKPEVSD